MFKEVLSTGILEMIFLRKHKLNNLLIGGQSAIWQGLIFRVAHRE